MFLILFNTITLSLDKFPEEGTRETVLENINLSLTICFMIEMVFKLLGLGFKEYARDRFNLFDAFLVIVSMIELIVSAVSNVNSGLSVITVFRSFRLFRVFKLARSWTSLK